MHVSTIARRELILRDGCCWQQRLTLNQEVVGSIPTLATFRTEGIRPDEETVLKTVAVNRRCGFESHIFRFSI